MNIIHADLYYTLQHLYFLMYLRATCTQLYDELILEVYAAWKTS
jgi:hypothetical protein